MIIPFINFAGQAAEAIAFYETVFEIANKQVMYFKDKATNIPKGMEGYILHAEMGICGTKVWIGDSLDGVTPGDAVSLAVTLPSKEMVLDIFNKLSDGGHIIMEPSPQFYSPLFAMVQDKFDVLWHLIC